MNFLNGVVYLVEMVVVGGDGFVRVLLLVRLGEVGISKCNGGIFINVLLFC